MKITRATIKSFIKKNQNNLYIKKESDFDGRVDCVVEVDGEFSKVEVKDMSDEHKLGVSGAWFVGGSRDYFTEFENENFKGFDISNSCGSFILAAAK